MEKELPIDEKRAFASPDRAREERPTDPEKKENPLVRLPWPLIHTYRVAKSAEEENTNVHHLPNKEMNQ